MVRTTPASAPRSNRLLACAALACSLAACGGGGDDDPVPATAATPVGGGQLGGGNPMAPVDGGFGDVPANDPGFGGTTGPVAGSVSIGGPIGGTATDVGGTTTTGSGDGEFEFECGGVTFVAGPGNTVTCDGVTYQVTADGEAVEVGGEGVGSGGAQTGGTSGEVAPSLVNAYTDADNFELWVCSSSQASGFRVGYTFDASGTGAYFMIPDDGSDIRNVGFEWRGTGPDSVLLNYSNGAEDITSIAFANGSTWTGFSSTDGSLECGLATVGA